MSHRLKGKEDYSLPNSEDLIELRREKSKWTDKSKTATLLTVMEIHVVSIPSRTSRSKKFQTSYVRITCLARGGHYHSQRELLKSVLNCSAVHQKLILSFSSRRYCVRSAAVTRHILSMCIVSWKSEKFRPSMIRCPLHEILLFSVVSEVFWACTIFRSAL
jgi:hypothetical protein